MGLSEALKLAESEGLDLIEVSPKASPPVCKIGDAARLKYEQKKKLQAGKKKQTKVQLKELRLRPYIGQHDLDVKIKSITKFLSEGCQIKISVRFRGREIVHSEEGKNLLLRILEQLGDAATVDSPIRLEGKQMVIKIVPKKVSPRAEA